MGEPRPDEAPADVLGRWREAERRMGEFEAGSAAWQRARLEAEGLAATYQQLIAQREDEVRELVGQPPGPADQAEGRHPRIDADLRGGSDPTGAPAG